MNRDQNHITDAKAQKVFNDLVPIEWVTRSQNPDYGIDFNVELTALNGDLTGKIFAVQLKGTKRWKKTPTHLRFRMERKHLLYYADKCTSLPVFLVVVNVQTREAYWVFVQRHILEQMGSRWRQFKSATVEVPRANRLDDTAAITKSVDDAINYMRSLYPAAITDAIAGRRKQLESLDARFKISTTATDNGTAHTLRVTEPVTIRMTFKGSPDRPQLDRR